MISMRMVRVLVAVFSTYEAARFVGNAALAEFLERLEREKLRNDPWFFYLAGMSVWHLSDTARCLI